MDHFEFEKKFLKHNWYYVTSLAVDFAQSKVHLELIFDPSTTQPAVILDFIKCEKISISTHGDEDDKVRLANFLGLQNIPKNGTVQYIITTLMHELSFVTDTQPIVEWFDKRALDFDYPSEVINMDKKSPNSKN